MTSTGLLTLTHARQIIAGAFAERVAAGMNPLCVVVVDAGGHLLALEREDGVPYGRVEIATGKAVGAMAIGPNSRTLGTMAVERPHFVQAASMAMAGALVPVAGGVVIVDESGNRIGAVGACGDTSDNDEQAVIAGIAAAGLTPQV